METLASEGGEIHLPERWAVLEEALREISAERENVNSGETSEITPGGGTKPAQLVRLAEDALE